MQNLTYRSLSLLSTLLLMIFCKSAMAGSIIYPLDDPQAAIKTEVLELIDEVMGPSNSASYVDHSGKVLLWANEAHVIPETSAGEENYKLSSLPSFTAATPANEAHLRQEITRLCQCNIEGKEIAGILVAQVDVAARMYFRAGWSGHTAQDVDGDVSPIVIIYHEFSHAKDYLQNPEYFFDLATQFDRRWKNKAEESAVMQQNDFVITLQSKLGIRNALRRSYGKNTLHQVSDYLDRTID